MLHRTKKRDRHGPGHPNAVATTPHANKRRKKRVRRGARVYAQTTENSRSAVTLSAAT